MGEGESSRLNVPRTGGDPWRGKLGKNSGRGRPGPEVVAKTDEEMSQVGKTGGEGAGGKGDPLGPEQAWERSSYGSHLKGPPSSGKLSGTAAPQAACGGTELARAARVEKPSNKWHRGDCAPAWRRG